MKYKNYRDIAEGIESVLRDLSLGRVGLERHFGINYSVLKYNLEKMKEFKEGNPKAVKEILEKLIEGIDNFFYKYSKLSDELREILKSYEELSKK